MKYSILYTPFAKGSQREQKTLVALSTSCEQKSKQVADDIIINQLSLDASASLIASYVNAFLPQISDIIVLVLLLPVQLQINAPKPTQFLAACNITLEVYNHVYCHRFLEDGDCIFAECVLRKISSTCVDTEPRGIVATCIVTGDRGRPCISSYCKQ